jgi:hypothetical protein
LFQVVSHTLSAETHVGKSEIVSNDAAPTVGAEFDRFIHYDHP